MAKFVNGINDVKICRNKMQMEKDCFITSQQVFDSLKDTAYRGSGLQKDPKSEGGGLPAIVPIFYKFIFDYGRIPTQRQLINCYIINYCEDSKPDENNMVVFKSQYCLDNDRHFKYHGVCARLLRTYPSLIREFHFYLLCQESNKFKRVAYSLTKDFCDGLDLRVDTEKDTYYVSMYVNTARSQQFKKEKYNRHDYTQVKEIKLGINLNECDSAGDFMLCNKNHVDKLIDEISEMEREEKTS